MRIAILGSVALPVPPKGQGGTEWMAYYQAQGLAERGHQVFLLASKDSKKTSGVKLIEVSSGGVVTGKKKEIKIDLSQMESSRKLRLEMVYLAETMEKLIEYQSEYDLILNNMRGEAVFLPLAKMLGKPFVNVMHLPIFEELAQLFKRLETPLIVLAEHQKRNFPELNYLATVGNGVDTSKYGYCSTPEDYLLMMGTIGHHKNQADAVKAAGRLGMKLILAGKIRDQDYYRQEIAPYVDGKQIIHLGEIEDFEEKLKLYQGALAFLFPVLWEEPFGLVMIEAMSCGTPVIGYANGAVPEVVRDGVTGFIIKNKEQRTENKKFKIKKTGVEGMMEAVKKITQLSNSQIVELRQACRKHVEENFTIEKMIDGYEKACQEILA